MRAAEFSACWDSLAFVVVIARGEEAVRDHIASVIGSGGATAPVAGMEAVKKHDKEDIMLKAWAEAEPAVTAKGCRGSGMECAVARAQVGKKLWEHEIVWATLFKHKAAKVQ